MVTNRHHVLVARTPLGIAIMTSPTVVDLFSGCGGGSIGFKAAGFRVVGAVEIEPQAAASYQNLVGFTPTVADICSVTKATLDLTDQELTLLFGCPPCQSFTVLRRGSRTLPRDDLRNALPMQYLRLVQALRPRYLAFENVPGLTEGRWLQTFEAFLRHIESIGYAVTWEVHDAVNFGVPQHRRRLLVMGSRVTKPCLPAPSHGEPERPHLTVRDAIADLRPLRAGESDPDDVMHFARRHRPIAVERLRHVPEGGGRMDLPPGLRLACHDGHSGHYDIYGRMSWDRPAPTLTSGCTNITRGRFAHPEQDRAITPREAMLLQGFPRYAGLRGGVEAVSLQIGNAIPPVLARHIGETVIRLERSLTGRGVRMAVG